MMKTFVTALVAVILIGCSTPQQQEQNNETMNKENKELTTFDVQKDYQKESPR
ncbi:MAG: hypothetical protein IKI09_11635 [Bacteroidales bacterium]|nr:hypothetical protein [Bacteroidales bacterium]